MVVALIVGALGGAVAFGGVALAAWLFLRHGHLGAAVGHAWAVIAFAAGGGGLFGFGAMVMSIRDVEGRRSGIVDG